MSTSATIDAALRAPTLTAAFLAVSARRGDRVALRELGRDRVLTYGEWRAQASALAGGLEALGVQRGDRVALLLGNRLEFHVVDLAALLIGAVPFSLYVTAPVEQLLEPLDNAEPVVLVTERALLDKAYDIVGARPGIRELVVVDGDAAAGALTLDAVAAHCPDGFDVEAAAGRVWPDDLCTLAYTSGTTGPPKGVQYRHVAWMETMRAIHRRLPFSPDGRVVAYLPMAHIAERMFGHYAGFVFGCEITAVPDASRLGEALLAARPTRFFGVPRIYEKLLAAIRAAGAAPGPAALAVVGLEHAEWLGAAGAPCPPALLDELAAVGLDVNEAYGMSETIIISTAPPHAIRPGTVGLPLDTIQTAIDDDGELRVRGSTVTPGYFGDPVRTQEAIDADGWMRTGDLVTVDDAGYLRVVGRKKELIINSAGKNMSPAIIEQAVKTGAPLIAHVVCVGDGRPYNVGLIAIDLDEARRLAPSVTTTADAAADPRVRDAVAAAVVAGNARLARVEQLKAHHLVADDWLPGGELLTPTGKLRRARILQRYAEVVERLYQPVPSA